MERCVESQVAPKKCQAPNKWAPKKWGHMLHTRMLTHLSCLIRPHRLSDATYATQASYALCHMPLPHMPTHRLSDATRDLLPPCVDTLMPTGGVHMKVWLMVCMYVYVCVRSCW